MSAWHPYYRLRRAASFACDRLGEFTDRSLARSAGWPPTVRAVVSPLLGAAGVATSWGRLSPRQFLSASGGLDALLFGDHSDVDRLSAVLGVPVGATDDSPQRVPVWHAREVLAKRLGTGRVVLAGLPPGFDRLVLPRAAFRVTILPVVGHVLPLGSRLDLRGAEHEGMRRSLTALDRHALRTRHATDRPAFDDFYDRFYVPHLTRRHGDAALIVDRDRQWRDWLARGAKLLLLDVDGTLAAGAIVGRAGDRAMVVEEGLNYGLQDQRCFGGLQAALKRAAIEWATAGGASELYMGLSPAAAASGVFRAKRLWGARPVPAVRSLIPVWTILANEMPRSFRDLVNRRRLVAFDHDRPCVVRIVGPDGLFEGPHRASDDLRRDGFQAILEVGSGYRRVRPLDDADKMGGGQ